MMLLEIKNFCKNARRVLNIVAAIKKALKYVKVSSGSQSMPANVFASFIALY